MSSHTLFCVLEAKDWNRRKGRENKDMERMHLRGGLAPCREALQSFLQEGHGFGENTLCSTRFTPLSLSLGRVCWNPVFPALHLTVLSSPLSLICHECVSNMIKVSDYGPKWKKVQEVDNTHSSLTRQYIQVSPQLLAAWKPNRWIGILSNNFFKHEENQTLGEGHNGLRCCVATSTT